MNSPLRRIATSVLLAGALLAPVCAQTNFTWVGGGGNWGLPANWSPAGVPGPADSAIITTGTPLLNVHATVSNLTLSASLAGDGTRVLTVLHSGTWSGGSLWNVRLKMDPTCVFGFTGGAKTLGSSSVITNEGRIVWSSGQLNLDSGQTFHNQPGGVFEAQFDGLMIQNIGGTSVFRNQGTYLKSGGAGTNTVNIVSFVNTGAVTASSGTVRLAGSSVTSAGPGNTLRAEAGARLLFHAASSGTLAFTDTTFAGPGAKTISVPGGTATVGGTVIATNLVFTAGTWQGNAVLNGSLEWTGGTLSPLLTIAAGSVLSLTGSDTKTLQTSGGSGAITNLGTVTWTSGQFQVENNATFHNRPGALFDVGFDGTLVQNTGGTSTFRNQGTYRKSGGPGTNTVNIVSFVNAGAVTALSGTIRMAGRSVTSAGPGNTLGAEAGARLLFKAASSGTLAFTDATFAGLGAKTISIPGGTAAVGGTVNATNLVFATGTWQGNAVLDGSLEWTGGTLSPLLTIAAGSVLSLTGSDTKTLQTSGGSGAITNLGTVTWTGGQFRAENNATFHNQPGALFDVGFDGTLIQTVAGTSTFRNQGTYRKSGGPGTNTISIGSFAQSGALEIQTGVVRVVGNLSPDAGSTLSTWVAGTTPGAQFGQLQVSGNVALAGTLQLALANGFVPSTNQTFPVVTAGTRSGVFNGTSGSAIGDGLYFTPIYLPNGVRLEVVNGMATTSAPKVQGGQFGFQLSGLVGGHYEIQASTNLVDWLPLATTRIPGSGLTNFVDGEPALLPYRFYRALFLP